MTSEAVPVEKRQSFEKPVTTKDIANLYSHLQTMMENVPKSPRLEHVTSSDGFLLTPTTSSSLSTLATNNKDTRRISVSSLPVKKTKEPDCPCHHIFVSKDSEHCALCDDIVPILSEIQQDREEKRQHIRELKDNLSKEKKQSKIYQQEIAQLEKKSEEVNAALVRTQKQYDSLKEDIKILELKCITETKEADKAKQEKLDVENELEELSQKLFEEANGMVANEKKEKHLLEIQYKNLQEELRLCREQMETEELQLKELKLKMGHMDEQSNHRSSSSSVSLVENVNEPSDNVEYRTLRDLSGFFAHSNNDDISPEETEDSLVLEEFKEFVETGESIPIRKLHSTSAYVKNSLGEDIEPCLRFGPNSRLSPKKLYEAILLNTCFIEEAPYGFAQDQAKRPSDTPLRISASKNMIWERLSSAPPPPFAGCQACGRNTNDLPYRFRISLLDDWACIDRTCRDQLVSVCEFYVYLRNIRQGYYNSRSISDLYQESLRLKLQMFYARMGALPQTLLKLGVKGDTVGRASEPNMIIPTLATSNIITDSLYIVDTPTDNNSSSTSLKSDTENEDVEIPKVADTTYRSTHPSNSVWISYTS